MSATTAIHLVSKMLDYQKNVHADVIAREIAKVSLTFLGMFGIELLFDLEGCRTSLLHICKVIVERKESTIPIDYSIKELFKAPDKQKILNDYIFQVHQKNDEFNDTRSNYKGGQRNQPNSDGKKPPSSNKRSNSKSSKGSSNF